VAERHQRSGTGRGLPSSDGETGGWRGCRLGGCTRHARWPRLSPGPAGRAARAGSAEPWMLAWAGSRMCRAWTDACSRRGSYVRPEPGEGSSFRFVLVRTLARTASVVVRVIQRLGARGHGHIADSVVAATLVWWRLHRSEGMWRCRQERTVKPSAQPTLVRTQHLPQHLPPPAKTAR
jgi:hypothetical protein